LHFNDYSPKKANVPHARQLQHELPIVNIAKRLAFERVRNKHWE